MRRLILGLCAVLLVSGCSTDLSNLDIPDKSFEDATLPLDFYSISEEDSVLEDHAMNLYLRDCLAEEGLDYPVGNKPTHAATLDPLEKGAKFQLYTEYGVSQYGYRHPESAEQAAERVELMKSFEFPNSLDEDGSQKFDQCWQEWDEQNLLGERVYELQDATVLSYGGNVQLNPEILDLVQPWKECVTESGLEVPLGMSPFDYTYYVWQQELPIAEEIAIAVADVRCRDESGYSAAYYDALWEHDYQVLVDNQKRLSDLPERIRASRARTEEFIDGYANQ